MTGPSSMVVGTGPEYIQSPWNAYCDSTIVYCLLFIHFTYSRMRHAFGMHLPSPPSINSALHNLTVQSIASTPTQDTALEAHNALRWELWQLCFGVAQYQYNHSALQGAMEYDGTFNQRHPSLNNTSSWTVCCRELDRNIYVSKKFTNKNLPHENKLPNHLTHINVRWKQ